MGTERGVVKFFNAVRGWGFITSDETGEELFVHQRAILMDGFRSLSEGQIVSYAIGEDEQGRTCAVEVFVIEHDEQQTTNVAKPTIDIHSEAVAEPETITNE